MKEMQLPDVPCMNCPKNGTCHNTCEEWTTWFHRVWSELRRRFLGLKEDA